MQAQVTFTGHTPKDLNGQHGPYTLHIFTAADGSDFTTTKTDVANAAYALLNQPVVVTYDETQKQGNNGQVFVNRRLSAVQAAGPGALPLGVLPPNAVEAPTAAPAASAAPTTGATGTRFPDHPDTAKRIARSVGLEFALKAAESGVVSVDSLDDLFDVAHGFGAYVFNGSRPGQAVERADSSGAVVGGEAGAAPVAPAPANPTPAVDDDIPF